MRGIVETSSMLVLSGTLLASCSQQGLVVLECPTGAIDSVVSLDESDELDLLLVIDDSLRMAEEQASLSAQLPRLISALAFGDRDGDGTVDFAPPRSIHVGIVTTDMGTGASVVMSCPGGNGDDGVLQTGGPYCASSHPTGIFELRQGESVPGFASMLGCMPIVGTAGCNFEQQLDAALKAVSPAGPTAWTRVGYVPPEFRDGTFGHAGPGGANDGFLRPNSTLAILVLTDEDDCSTTDDDIFNPASTTYSGELNLRCHDHATRLQPVERYVDGLTALRANPGHILFHLIAGVPPDRVGASPDVILADPAMVETIDPATGTTLRPACVSPDSRGVAVPARRLVEVARGLQSRGSYAGISSVCASDFTSAIDAFVAEIGDMLQPRCLPSPIPLAAPGAVSCQLSVVPESGTSCESLGLPAGTMGECALQQVTDPARRGTTPGWFYDDDPTGPASRLVPGCDQRITLSATTLPRNATYHLHCCP